MSDFIMPAPGSWTLGDLDRYFRSFLPFEAAEKADYALNGVQVGDFSAPVQRVAFAVDACLETFERAASWKAQALVVHHGIFWGRQFAFTGAAYDRMAFLCKNDLALYGVHMPLDMVPGIGNNAALAGQLGLRDTGPFGTWKGVKIGCRGILPHPMSVEEVAVRLFGEARSCLALLPFGKKENLSVAIVSGGTSDLVEEAIREGIDLFVTGDADHTVYHDCLEAGINVIFGGHYQTETWGVSLLSQKVEKEAELETVFIDLPTGL